MRNFLIIPLLLFISCTTEVENAPVEYYYIMDIEEYTIGENKVVPEFYEEGQIVYSISSRTTTITLKLKATTVNLIKQEFSKKQQGLEIEDIHLVQRYSTKRQGESITLDEILTYIVVRGENVEIVQNHFNRVIKDRKNNVNVGYINLLTSPGKINDLFYFPEIDSKNILKMSSSEGNGTITGDDLVFRVKILPKYKHINP